MVMGVQGHSDEVGGLVPGVHDVDRTSDRAVLLVPAGAAEEFEAFSDQYVLRDRSGNVLITRRLQEEEWGSPLVQRKA